MFRVIELLENEIIKDDPTCILSAFKYVVQHIETETIWFGSDDITVCEKYISDYGN